MTVPIDDRFKITLGPHTTQVTISLGKTEVAVNMRSVPGIEDLSEAQVRQAVMRQLRRVLEVARKEIG